MKQILLNLISNAVKFTSAGSVVIEAGYAETGEFIFSVSDTGIGMSEEDMAKALLPFLQVDTSLARRYEGTGLGLTLTKSLVEMHGGKLDMKSCLGEGTCVTVRLPSWRAEGEDLPAA